MWTALINGGRSGDGDDMSDKKQPNMTPEQKEEYLKRKFEEGRRQARAILGKRSKPKMTRQELKDVLAEKYPGLTLSDQIIEDKKACGEKVLGRTSERTMPDKPSSEDPPGIELLETPRWVYEMAKRYGEPTISLDELREMMDKELDGESLSDFLIEDRRKNPY